MSYSSNSKFLGFTLMSSHIKYLNDVIVLYLEYIVLCMQSIIKVFIYYHNECSVFVTTDQFCQEISLG